MKCVRICEGYTVSVRKTFFVACLYKTFRTKEGVLVWIKAGPTGRSRWRVEYAEQDAVRLATENRAVLMKGVGSLHNKRAELSDSETLDLLLQEIEE